MDNKLISIVVPVYNVENYLERCINSLINQTYKNIQIILVDDGSNDNSPSICDYYKSIYKNIVVIHKENGGLSDARNKGIDVARGEYITFVDSDDYVELDYIEYMYNLIEKDLTEIAICGYIVHFDNQLKKLKDYYNSSKMDTEKVLKRILYSNKIEVSAWAKLYKTSLFKNVRYPKGKLFEDIGTTYKLLEKCKVISVGLSPKYHYIMRKDSIVNKKFTEKHKYMIEATKNMCDDVLSSYPKLNKACKRRLSYAYISTLDRMIMSSNRNYEEEKDYRKTILRNSGLIFDFNTPIRDKLAIMILFFGVNVYKKAWTIYKKTTKRI